MLEKAKELNVEFVVVDNTSVKEEIAIDLQRSNQEVIPVNIIYPPNYPNEPAILLNEVITPTDALEALERMAKIQNRLQANEGSVASAMQNAP